MALDKYEINPLWSCGWNQYGQLGLGNTSDKSSFTKVGSSTWSAVAADGWSDSSRAIE